MRGRLLNPFKAKLFRLNTVATAADPDAGGELTAGYDATFREPVRLPTAEAAGAKTVRKEHTAVLLPCQFEGDDAQGALTQTAAGNDARFLVRLVLHFRDLEEAGLVDATSGEALVRTGDRLESLHRYSDDALIQYVGGASAGAGGLYCIEARPVSFGLSGGERNLLVAVFADRDGTYKGGA